MKKLFKKNKAQISVYILFFTALFVFILSGSTIWIYFYLNTISRSIDKIQAFYIAESGNEYYRWFLNHFPQDYTDGTGKPGPYVHTFYNRLGEAIGEFILNITPPETGSNVVYVYSKGKIYSNPSIEKNVFTILARPSLAKYAVAVDDNIRFGEGTVVYGEIHSNKGIRFDGKAYNLVKSSLIIYQDPDHEGCKEWAVHTHVPTTTYPEGDPCPDPSNPEPSTIPYRPDVFVVGRKVGAPIIDFVGISADFYKLRDLAQKDGFYLPFAGDLRYGYEIILKDNGTFDVYKVEDIVPQPKKCEIYDTYEGYGNNNRYIHSTWSILTKTFLGNYPYPKNGIIFVEDNVWVSGKISDKKLLIVSAKLPDVPAQRTNIIINNDLTYTNYDGRDIIGLIAQRNINVGLKSEDELRIDGALMVQNGRVGRYYYSEECGPEYKRTKITVYGSIITRRRYGFSWVSGNVWTSGYRDREIVYNNDLLYFPPPFFPLASEFYEIVKWQEAK